MMSLPVRLAVVGTLTALYLGLAIGGFGDVAGFFAEPARAAVVGGTVALVVLALVAGGNVSPGVREERDNRWVIAVFLAIGLTDAVVPPLCDRLDLLTVGGPPLRWIGVALYLAGGVLRMLPVFVLGDRFSGLVAIQPGHTLVTTGLYARIRNPSYLGLLINMVGWALAFRSLAGLALTAALLPPLMARMRAEERLLLSEFGAAYAAYRDHTARLIPGLY